MCLPLRDRGHEVRLVGTYLDSGIIDHVKSSGRHPKLNVKLPDGVKGFHHTEFAAALGDDTDLILLGISSTGVNWAIDRLCESLKKPVPVVMITKGMHPEPNRLVALPDYVAAQVKSRTGVVLDIAAIGGPCIAGELAVRRQTGTVITAKSLKLAGDLCAMFETGYYHPRVSPDVIGTEICAAFKNFFAIAVGWAAGHRETMAATENNAFNHNAGAILFDQAIRELMVVVMAHGGSAESVWGMPGAGDLYVTCQAGRNSRLGNNLGRGLTYSQTKNGPMKGDTIEGAETGITVAKTLRAMMAEGSLDSKQLPLTIALLDALTNDTALTIPWSSFHRMG